MDLLTFSERRSTLQNAMVLLSRMVRLELVVVAAVSSECAFVDHAKGRIVRRLYLLPGIHDEEDIHAVVLGGGNLVTSDEVGVEVRADSARGEKLKVKSEEWLFAGGLAEG